MPLPESCCCFSPFFESSGCDVVQNLCSAISERCTALHTFFMYVGSDQRLLDG